MPVCTTDKLYEGEGVQLFYNKVFHRVHSENVPKVPNVINLIHAWGVRRNIVVAPDACGCSSTGGQVGLLF